jgi:hypothetical protein
MSTAGGGTSGDAGGAFGEAPPGARAAFGDEPERPAFLPPRAEPARGSRGGKPANWWPRVGATVLDQLAGRVRPRSSARSPRSSSATPASSG